MDLAISYVSSLPHSSLESLLSDVWTCQALFRSLSSSVKQVVGRLIHVSDNVLVSTIRGWFKKMDENDVDDAIRNLLELHFIVPSIEHSQNNMPTAIKFNELVRKSLSEAFDGMAQGRSTVEWRPSEGRVLQISDDRWKSILYFIVGSQNPIRPATKIISILSHHNLVLRKNNVYTMGSNGFHFLLQSTITQIWRLLTVFASMEGPEIVSLAFRLASLQLGKSYNVSDLSPFQQHFLPEFESLGLAFRSEAHPNVFSSTPLAQNLTQKSGSGDGYLIVESNNRVYAYTPSTLEFSILSLFVQMQYRLPNMAVGTLTKQSVGAAFDSEISANEIVRFLKEHSHIESSNHDRRAVPPAVCDQLRLWEAERNRVTMRDAKIYKGFNDLPLFRQSAKFAHEKGILLYGDVEGKMLVIDKDHCDVFDEFLESTIY